MPAAIDTTEGVSSFASFRDVAWHQLVDPFTDTVTDYRVMLQRANLADWNVRFHELELAGFPGVKPLIPTTGVVRTNPVNGGTDWLGTVGGRFTIVQNEDVFAFLAGLYPDAPWETAGAIKGGRTVFGSIGFDREIVLDPSGAADVVRTYGLGSSSFDGSGQVVFGDTKVRVVCANTLDVAMRGLSNTIKFRHTRKVEEKMALAAKVRAHVAAYDEAFEAEAHKLFAQSVSDKKFWDIVAQINKAPAEDASKRAQTTFEQRQELYAQAWQMEANAPIRGTAWGAVNALTEVSQWGRGRKGDNGDENFAAAGAGFDPAARNDRQKALEVVKTLAFS